MKTNCFEKAILCSIHVHSGGVEEDGEEINTERECNVCGNLLYPDDQLTCEACEEAFEPELKCDTCGKPFFPNLSSDDCDRCINNGTVHYKFLLEDLEYLHRNGSITSEEFSMKKKESPEALEEWLKENEN